MVENFSRDSVAGCGSETEGEGKQIDSIQITKRIKKKCRRPL